MSEEIKNVAAPAKKKDGFFDSLIVAFVVAMILRALVVQAYRIPSESMLNTLLVGDHIIVNKLSYLVSEPERGDVVVFEYPIEPEKDYIKRIVAVPGDKIKIVDKQLYRNGEKVEEPFKRHSSMEILTGDSPDARRDNLPEMTVPAGTYFMMGDNRDDSFDSRFWGFVRKDSIRGKAIFIYWSWDDAGNGLSVRWDRLLDGIH